MIKSREAVVSALYKQGGGVEPPLPQVGKVTPPVSPLNLPDEVAKLQYAYDRFGVLLPDSPKIALFSYKAAEIDFRYLRFRKCGCGWPISSPKFCKDERAVDAGNALLVSYNIEGDLEKPRGVDGAAQRQRLRWFVAGCADPAWQHQKLSQQVRFKKPSNVCAETPCRSRVAVYRTGRPRSARL